MKQAARTAALSSLMLAAPDGQPTQQHFAAIGAMFGTSARTIRRLWNAADQPARVETGPSAQRCLDSLGAVDPRTLFVSEPSGDGWWPDTAALVAIGASKTRLEAWETLQASDPHLPGYAQFTRRLNEILTPAMLESLTGKGPVAGSALELFLTRSMPSRMTVVEFDSVQLPIDTVDRQHSRKVKPWLIVGVDVGTRAVVGWDLVMTRPSSADAARVLALTAVGTFHDSVRVGGLPEAVRPDNGGEFRKVFEQACQALGIQWLHLPPHTPHLKGCVEAFGGTIQDELVAGLPGATHGPVLRGDAQPWRDVEELLTFQAMYAEVDRYIRGYNTTRPHSTLGGSTPIQAWLADTAPVRFVDDMLTLLPYMHCESRKVTKNGVPVNKVDYLCPGLKVGRHVQVAWLPRHGHWIEVLDETGEHVGTGVVASSLSEQERDSMLAPRKRRERAANQLLSAGSKVRLHPATVPAPIGSMRAKTEAVKQQAQTTSTAPKTGRDDDVQALLDEVLEP